MLPRYAGSARATSSSPSTPTDARSRIGLADPRAARHNDGPIATREVTTAELTTPPYSAVGLILVHWPNGTHTQGSVAMVGPNDVLTATHVIYDPARGGLATNFDLFFGIDFNSITDTFESTVHTAALKAGTFNWEALRFPERVFTDADPGVSFAESQFDVALIGLSQPVGNATGWFGIDATRDFAQVATEIGYPENGTGMMTGTVSVDRNATYGVYLASGDGLGPGSSGGPLFGDDFRIIGVKSGGSGGLQSWADIGMVKDAVFSYIAHNDWLMSPRTPTQAEVMDGVAVYRAFHGMAPDKAAYDAMIEVLARATPGVYADSLASKFSAVTSDLLAATVLRDVGANGTTLGGSNPAGSYDAVRMALAQVFDSHADARGQVVLNITNLLGGLEADPVYGRVAQDFNDMVERDYATLVGVSAQAEPLP